MMKNVLNLYYFCIYFKKRPKNDLVLFRFVLYYLHNKNLSAHFDVYLRLYLTNPKKIGDEIKALQICKQSAQTASL